MKKYGKYLIAAVAGLVFFAACDNYEADDHKFGNAVYLDVAETNEVQLTTFGNNKPTYDCALQAELTYPAGQDVAVTLTVDPSLVGTYNARYGTEWTMLDAKYYKLSAESVTIAAGKTTSDVVTLQFKELMGQGEEQTRFFSAFFTRSSILNAQGIIIASPLVVSALILIVRR